ncbi:MAG: metallopeptidase family protein [Rhodospirillaceae bacterium]|nr:metallopeptidase family protein [Rhodospirillaceae bacterium]
MRKTAEIIPPSLADIDTLAREALGVLPEELREFTEGVVVLVQEFPDDAVMAEMELESPFDILGLYSGVSLAEKRVEASGGMPDMVFLYRRPILDYWCETGEDLKHVVRHVLIHEIGHHFGFSDEEMETLETIAEAEENARDN